MRAGLVAAAAVIGMSVVTLGGRPVGALPNFTVAPTNLTFQATTVGATSSIVVTVTNVSGATHTPNIAGGAPFDQTNFGGSQNCAGKTLSPTDTCTFTYEFHPTAPGSHSTTTTISVGGESFGISMSGTGVAATPTFDVAPTALTFPDTPVGGTSAIDVIVTNAGSAPATPNFAGGAPIDPTHFTGSQNCAGKTFAPGDTCAFTYEFIPVAEGTWSTTTTIGIGSQNVAISMTGTSGPPPTTTTDPTATTGPTSATDAPDGTTPDEVTGIVIVEPPLPGGSDAAVIAQGIVEFGTDAVAWNDTPLAPDAWPFPFDGATATFLALTGRDAVLVTAEDDRSVALLDDGEAAFLAAEAPAVAGPLLPPTPATEPTTVVTLEGGAPAPVAHVVSLLTATGEGAFAPGEGRRDVNLIRDVLAPGDQVEVRSPFPILVIVVDGELVDTRDGDTVLVTHTATTLETTIVLRNDTEAPATLLAAAVGGPVP